MSKFKNIPEFKSENEEFEFWSTHDSTEYIDYPRVKRVLFSNLKPSTRTISLRLPESLIEHLREPTFITSNNVPLAGDIFMKDVAGFSSPISDFHHFASDTNSSLTEEDEYFLDQSSTVEKIIL